MEEQKGNAGQDLATDGAGSDKQDMVSYDSYRKVVGAKKAQDSKFAEMQEKIQAFEQKELESTGQKDTLIESLRDELSKKEQLLKKKDSDYAWKMVSGEIKEAALKESCTDVNVLLTQLSQDGSLEALQVNDDFSVNQEDLKRVMDNAKTKYAGIRLFDSKKVNVNNPPIEGKPTPKKQKSVSEMTVAEMKAAYLKLNGF